MAPLREHLYAPTPSTAPRPHVLRGVPAWAQRWVWRADEGGASDAGYSLHPTRQAALDEREAIAGFWHRWVEPELELPPPRLALGEPFAVRIDHATARDLAAAGSLQRPGAIAPAGQ